VILRNLSFTRLVWNRERGLMINLILCRDKERFSKPQGPGDVDDCGHLVAQQIYILASPEGISTTYSNQIPEGECRL